MDRRPDAPRRALDKVGLSLLGRALQARSDDVVASSQARNEAAGSWLGDDVEKQFAHISHVSTIAVARWMAGEPADVARNVGREAWTIFGQLAASRTVALDQVTKRCLRWADAANEVLARIAAANDISSDVLHDAETMVRRSLAVTLVRMCESFETVRRQTDEQLEVHQEELAFLATHDPLTGLPNRTLILDRAQQMLARSRRQQGPIAAFFIDLDNFKSINDTLGREVGDEMLRAVTARLEGIVRDTDVLGRVSGDEFIVIADSLSIAGGPELVAERLMDALKHPFEVGAKATRVTVTASIGIACGQQYTPAELLRDADIAMFQAKRDGKDRYVTFATEMQDSVQARMELEMDLRSALDNDEFFLVYQPTLDLDAMRPTGVEALLRWQHPQRGLVLPADFIPMLEETGMIVEIGRWVLDHACAQASRWHRIGFPIAMAVNVSGRQLDDSGFIVDVRNALAGSGLDPAMLTIEITETALMRNAQTTSRLLLAIKELGVRIAIDDFGTGYSSLAHLRKFPVDSLKIDRSFVSGLTRNQEGETLVRTLVELGKALSIETLAEGIEQPHELAFLRAANCDSGQGFLFAQPLTAVEAETFLHEWSKTNGTALPAPARPAP
jgi:diguanylate cyclase (GGDEF)-like protein